MNPQIKKQSITSIPVTPLRTFLSTHSASKEPLSQLLTALTNLCMYIFVCVWLHASAL